MYLFLAIKASFVQIICSNISRLRKRTIMQFSKLSFHSYSDFVSIRDLLDLTKDNLQIKEAKLKGIYIDGATEASNDAVLF